MLQSPTMMMNNTNWQLLLKEIMEVGYSRAAIADKVGVHRSTIGRALKEKSYCFRDETAEQIRRLHKATEGLRLLNRNDSRG
jgi:IS30 family transposase